jgi:hypothetical protein
MKTAGLSQHFHTQSSKKLDMQAPLLAGCRNGLELRLATSREYSVEGHAA